MGLREHVTEVATTLGVTDIEVSPREVDAWSPKGFVFAATGGHSLVVSRWDDDTARDMYRSAIRDLRLGLEPCGDPECEECCR